MYFTQVTNKAPGLIEFGALHYVCLPLKIQNSEYHITLNPVNCTDTNVILIPASAPQLV